MPAVVAENGRSYECDWATWDWVPAICTHDRVAVDCWECGADSLNGGWTCEHGINYWRGSDVVPTVRCLCGWRRVRDKEQKRIFWGQMARSRKRAELAQRMPLPIDLAEGERALDEAERRLDETESNAGLWSSGTLAEIGRRAREDATRRTSGMRVADPAAIEDPVEEPPVIRGVESQSGVSRGRFAAIDIDLQDAPESAK